jgi:hypothetical protein
LAASVLNPLICSSEIDGSAPASPTVHVPSGTTARRLTQSSSTDAVESSVCLFASHRPAARWIEYARHIQGNTSDRCGQIPAGYDFYLWYKEDGYNNLGDWIETAAKAAGK